MLLLASLAQDDPLRGRVPGGVAKVRSVSHAREQEQAAVTVRLLLEASLGQSSRVPLVLPAPVWTRRDGGAVPRPAVAAGSLDCSCVCRMGVGGLPLAAPLQQCGSECIDQSGLVRGIG